jgi:hypothetical protein
MSKMGLHNPFRDLKHKLWPKEKPRIKLAIWHPTIKSWESPRFLHVQVVCNITLEISWQRLQLCVRFHLNQRFAHKVMGPQSQRSPNFGNFETWSPGRKCHLDVGLMERHKLYYKGEDGGFPQVRAVMNLVSPSLPMACLNTKSVSIMH